jgi:hypothetical protein
VYRAVIRGMASAEAIRHTCGRSALVRANKTTPARRPHGCTTQPQESTDRRSTAKIGLACTSRVVLTVAAALWRVWRSAVSSDVGGEQGRGRALRATRARLPQCVSRALRIAVPLHRHRSHARSQEGNREAAIKFYEKSIRVREPQRPRPRAPRPTRVSDVPDALRRVCAGEAARRRRRCSGR